MEFINQNIDGQQSSVKLISETDLRDLHFITKYKTPSNSYSVFLKPMRIDLLIAKNMHYEIFSSYEIPYSRVKLIQSYFKSKNYSMSKLITRLIEIMEVTRDK